MRKIIENQLKQVRLADLSNYNSETGICIIPKYSKPTYDIGKCYIIKIPAHLINNPMSVLSTNWNHGNSPKCEYIKAYVSKYSGKMIYVDSIGFDIVNNKDLNIMWSGWLPMDEITQTAAL